MVDEEFLYKYINANSPTGHEDEGQHIWIDYVRGCVDKIETDSYANVIGIINPEAKFKVVIEAHADEISWAVKYITKEGYIYVARNGGVDYEVAPATRILVHLDNGTKINGVFGWWPVHIRRGEEKNRVPDSSNIILDVGCSSDEEVKNMGIHVGTMVTQDASVIKLNNGKFYVGRAFDNRMGGVIIAHVAKKIKENNIKLPFGLYVCNCVQEEIGLRGAGMVANRIKPNLAIATDVTHDTQSPHYNKIKQGDIACGKGPVLTYAPAVNRPLRQFIADIAKECKINIQDDFSAPSTGTDTDSFAYCQEGIPSALISLPLKYMHTPVETVNHNDLEMTIELMYNTVIKLTPEFNVNVL